MKQEDIIRMAREVYGETDFHESALFHLTQFAALVAEVATEAANARANNAWALMCKKMVAAEREACAVIAERYEESMGGAEAIRARGQA